MYKTVYGHYNVPLFNFLCPETTPKQTSTVPTCSTGTCARSTPTHSRRRNGSTDKVKRSARMTTTRNQRTLTATYAVAPSGVSSVNRSSSVPVSTTTVTDTLRNLRCLTTITGTLSWTHSSRRQTQLSGTSLKLYKTSSGRRASSRYDVCRLDMT